MKDNDRFSLAWPQLGCLYRSCATPSLKAFPPPWGLPRLCSSRKKRETQTCPKRFEYPLERSIDLFLKEKEGQPRFNDRSIFNPHLKFSIHDIVYHRDILVQDVSSFDGGVSTRFHFPKFRISIRLINSNRSMLLRLSATPLLRNNTPPRNSFNCRFKCQFS